MHNKQNSSQPIFINNIVALVHFGRSGSGLLHSLIDGHSQVSTLPSVYLSEFFDCSTWRMIIEGGWDEMVDRFIRIYKVLFDASASDPIASKTLQSTKYFGHKEGMTRVGDMGDKVLSVDKTLFRKELNRLMGRCEQLDALVFFKLVQAAYDKAIKDTNNKNLILYHIHNPDTYAQLNFLRLAPDSNWIMMVREPLQSCESWIKIDFHDNDPFAISTKIVSMLFEIDKVIYHRYNSLGVRLEDLKNFPKKTISALCDWMGIEDNKSLYEMTAQGQKWWGDPTSPDFAKDGMNPFGKTSINRKVGSIFSQHDQLILSTLFYPFSSRFGYVDENIEQFKGDLKTIRPMLDEMFDFEKAIVEKTQTDTEQFMKSGSYLYLRSGLIKRWNTLNEFHTYPNMIKPLAIDQTNLIC